ncbi:hypothetical protein NDU88_005259 [Pleurodeles waltl]|uniref:Uncharacterized protein n=1 Tax=Pleurodeles waltl TaxID=8319 RepID=A0AAV7ULD4_PLEWA|nr:hypothetical protein NDU88_005259 [Pleurodeles waltl]
MQGPAPSGRRMLLGLVVPPGAKSQVRIVLRGIAACFVAPGMQCPAPSGQRMLLGLVVPPGAKSQVRMVLRGIAARFVAPAMQGPAPSDRRMLLGLVVPPGAKSQILTEPETKLNLSDMWTKVSVLTEKRVLERMYAIKQNQRTQ